ncbi:hypothetical protein D9757_004069 [Collybiopsis confluens]|uniref:Ubiquitin-like protease family profile domain-containing protein n=1 Tax=Collybiopsis confluens TaxID=2823264 RepID=A0A8H5HWK6_9AGAR|nr:hypothetical protein D9757_004069 [Collybiopsis confluens]
MSDEILRPPKPPDNNFTRSFINGHKIRRKNSGKSRKAHVEAHNIKRDDTPDVPTITQVLSREIPRNKFTGFRLPELDNTTKGTTQKYPATTPTRKLQPKPRANKAPPNSFTGFQIPKLNDMLPSETPTFSPLSFNSPTPSFLPDNIGVAPLPSQDTSTSQRLFKFPIEFSPLRLRSIIRGIKETDITRLDRDKYLNDTLIEYGLLFWHYDLRMRNPALGELVHVFNSFFYHQLCVFGPSEGYERVKTWTSSNKFEVDIFAKDFVIVPINESFHWYLAIIHRPKFILPYYLDSPTSPFHPQGSEIAPIEINDEVLIPPPTSQTIIYILDSLGIKHPRVASRLTSYLQSSAKEKHGCSNTLRAVERHIKPNAHDCGVFLLHFAELFVERIVNSSDSLVYNEKEWDIDRLIDYRTRMKRHDGVIKSSPCVGILPQRDFPSSIARITLSMAPNTFSKESAGRKPKRRLKDGEESSSKRRKLIESKINVDIESEIDSGSESDSDNGSSSDSEDDSSKRKKKKNKSRMIMFTSFIKLARIMPGLCHPQPAFLQIFQAGLEDASQIEPNQLCELSDDPTEINALLDSYDFMKQRIGENRFNKLLLKAIKMNLLDRLICKMNGQVSDVISQDVRDLKDTILQYVEDTLGEELVPRIPPDVKKANTRGFHHIQLARLLVPATKLDPFLVDPVSFCAKYLEDELDDGRILASQPPSFFYPDLGVSVSNDFDLIFDGLLQGWLVLQTMIRLFLGAANAQKFRENFKDVRQGTGAGTKFKVKRTGKAWKHRITSISFQMIAYTTFIIRHSLSSCDDRRSEEGGVVKTEAFDVLMSLAQDPALYNQAFFNSLEAFYKTHVGWMLPQEKKSSLLNEWDPQCGLNIMAHVLKKKAEKVAEEERQKAEASKAIQQQTTETPSDTPTSADDNNSSSVRSSLTPPDSSPELIASSQTAFDAIEFEDASPVSLKSSSSSSLLLVSSSRASKTSWKHTVDSKDIEEGNTHSKDVRKKANAKSKPKSDVASQQSTSSTIQPAISSSSQITSTFISSRKGKRRA